MRRTRGDQNRQFYAEVGRLIAKARNGRATQDHLAKRTGLTRTSIINIEKGRQQVYLHTLVDIASALEVPVSELIPPSDKMDALLRDKPQNAVEWIRLSTASEGKKK
ncbi:hypothetical protein HYPDE_26823 [Hyphomicrobium denitrificans 1NES1]|uniref:HTH cro/C1-type domain-containing protein n=1 Tax=Hyphomicrobium denitrificans 1NES1 TaxID=670307 RepID=N0BAB7_9HYPH|nr:helix-turn-helix transcriptional regulator [Hyphomicrobium denitrificans]AGK57045.1 hypothetical protein HYPDE_26823 [Hyphomicrobium denitrificans 1NES1]